MKNRIFAFANQKGGVGKTTCCVNLAAALALSKRRVLVCDLDPQGNATMASGVDKNALSFSMNDLLQQKASVREVLIPQTPAGYDLLPANSDLTAAEVILVKKQAKPVILSEALSPFVAQYDLIFFDCPPSLNMLTLNALVAAQKVMIAMQCEYFALEGISDLINTIKQLQSTVNPTLSVAGIIRTLYDGRNRLSTDVSKQLIAHFGNKVFRTVIPRNIRVAEAPSYGLPVHLYDKYSKGAQSYLALAHEFLQREKSEKGKEKWPAKEEA